MTDQICLPYELLRLHGSPLEGFFFAFVFPWLFMLGLAGNSLNLVVLLNPGGRGSVRRRSDSLLIALALCDMLFLILLLPSALAQFDPFGQHPRFRVLYLSLRVHLVAFANWCSAVAIWLIIAICADRLFGIRSLRHPPRGIPCCGTGRMVCCIVLLSGLLTSYNHFSYHCVLKYVCGHSQVVGKCFDVLEDSWPGNHTNRTPHPLRFYVRWSMAANALLVVVLPVLLMLFLNAALLVAVRTRSFRLPDATTPPPPNSSSQRLIRRKRSSSLGANPAWTSCRVAGSFARSGTDQSQAEHRVTVGVAAIVSCFTLTQGPSALVLLANLVVSPRRSPVWETVGSFTCFLVILGKTLNCVLLCLSSAAFRRRVAQVFTHSQERRHVQRGLWPRRTSSDNRSATQAERKQRSPGGTGLAKRKYSLP